jgi:hypothetical protein
VAGGGRQDGDGGTADSYHIYAGEVGHNEILIAQALASWPGDPSGVLVATDE